MFLHYKFYNVRVCNVRFHTCNELLKSIVIQQHALDFYLFVANKMNKHECNG